MASEPAVNLLAVEETPIVRNGVGVKILVVDDNADAAESMALLLQQAGHHVSIAHDGPTALSIADRERPRVVLLDIGLPGMDGYEVCRELRKTGHDAIIVALTGYGQEEDRQRSREAGFDGHQVKPGDPAELMRLLARSAASSPTA